MGQNAQFTEAQEQARLVAYLRRRGWLFSATANGVGTSPVQRSRMAALGVQRGVPDVFVFEPTEGSVGIAIELKRASGGVVSPEQRRWVEWLTARGWLAFVAHGADDAIRRIEAAYGPEETE